MATNEVRDHKITEEEKLRLHRWGMVEALMDCLALLEQAGREGAALPQAALQQAVESWLLETSGKQASASKQAASKQAASKQAASKQAASKQASATEQAVDAGRHEGYRACAEWLAEGLDRDVLTARLLQGVFAVWPRDAADYQRGYDAFLEKELEHPRALYYSSSHVWMTAVDDLRTKVACAGEQGQVLSHRIVRRAVKLLHMHPEHLASHFAEDLTPAEPPASGRRLEPTPAEAVTKRAGSPFGAGIWRRLRRHR